MNEQLKAEGTKVRRETERESEEYVSERRNANGGSPVNAKDKFPVNKSNKLVRNKIDPRMLVHLATFQVLTAASETKHCCDRPVAQRSAGNERSKSVRRNREAKK